MRIRTSFMAIAVLAALGLPGLAWSQDQNEYGRGDNNATHSDDNSGNNRDNTSLAASVGLGNAAASNNSTATANWSNSFNTNKAIAKTELVGVVTGNTVHGLGNVALNVGDSSGGDGGSGGHGLGGIAAGGNGDGGRGGDAGAAGVGGSAAGGWGGDAGAIDAALGGDADARTGRVRERGAGNGSSGDATATGGDGSSGDATATGGDGTATSLGLGLGLAAGGAGDGGDGGDATGGDGAGASGGSGGDGGSNTAHAGNFDMSNYMNGSANAAAGIMVVAQNSGASSLIQQGVTVQANLNVGGP